MASHYRTDTSTDLCNKVQMNAKDESECIITRTLLQAGIQPFGNQCRHHQLVSGKGSPSGKTGLASWNT